MLQKRKKPLTSQYGEAWQKERQRLNQLNQQGDNAESAKSPTANSDRPHPQQGALFVPVTWLSECEPHYYSSSDPEWEAYATLGRDAKRRQAIKSMLTDKVCKMVGNHDVVTRAIGKPLKVYGSWLDFDLPYMAPAQYECSGILLVGNKVTWATRRFDDGQVKRLYRVLLPTPLFSSLQAFSSTLLKSHYGSFKSLWSWPEQSRDQTFADRAVAESPSPTISQDGSQTSTVADIRKRSSTPQQSTSPGIPPNMQAEYIRNTMFRQELNSTVLAAAKAFQLNFSRQSQRHPLHHPRGACFLRGEVGVAGSKGRCKLSVFSVYLPKENTFVQIAAVPVGIWRTETPPARRQPKNPRKI